MYQAHEIALAGALLASGGESAAVKQVAQARQVGFTEVYLTPDQNGAIQDVLTACWNTGMTVDRAQKNFASALKN